MSPCAGVMRGDSHHGVPPHCARIISAGNYHHIIPPTKHKCIAVAITEIIPGCFEVTIFTGTITATRFTSDRSPENLPGVLH